VRKGELLATQLRRVTPLEASYLVRIITGDLRIGLKEGLVEEAVAAAFGVDGDEVREANMLLGDIGRTAVLAAGQSLAQAALQLFRPIKCMLASPEPDAETAAARISGIEAWAEDKFDGIRAHLHASHGRVEIFTRDLRPVTDQFADLARAARALPGELILDGEIVAFDAGRKLTFFDLQKRLGRKTEDDLFLGRSDIPVVYKVFDLLHRDGSSLLKTPLHERRAQLVSMQLPASLELAESAAVRTADEIEAAFGKARRRGNEGLIIKDAASFYTPGRRGIAWLKLKKELATLDVVVVGAESGHGRRSHVLSDYTFAVRDDASGALLTIGKAYSGLTDVEIEELTEHFRANTIVKQGRFREVRPDTVLEIAFDSVQPSARHSSGLALRFPRIKAIRRDKSPADIDTLSFARSLCART
jgi:DNA ligase-1